jgi:AcrR family transcriptional regulator
MTTNQLTTHDKLRHEAAGLFAKRGYGGTSMGDIAKRVGVRKASLYNYYDSKADLMLDLLEGCLRDWRKSCQMQPGPETSIEDQLATYLRAALRFAENNPQAVGIIRLAAGQMPRDLRRRVHAILESYEGRWRDLLADLFQEAIDRGEIEKADPKDLSLFLGVFLDGVIIRQIFAAGETNTVFQEVPALWKLFWRGISGHPPTKELAL